MPLNNHTVEVIETKEFNDEEVGYKYRCCGEQMTDSWVVVRVTAPQPDQDATIQTHVDNMKSRHEAKLQWRKKQQSQGVGNGLA